MLPLYWTCFRRELLLPFRRSEQSFFFSSHKMRFLAVSAILSSVVSLSVATAAPAYDPIYNSSRLHYKKVFSRFKVILDTSRGEDKVKVFFEDGTTNKYNLLIGANRSHLRFYIILCAITKVKD